jgi:hypothetical protein
MKSCETLYIMNHILLTILIGHTLSVCLEGIREVKCCGTTHQALRFIQSACRRTEVDLHRAWMAIKLYIGHRCIACPVTR